MSEPGYVRPECPFKVLLTKSINFPNETFLYNRNTKDRYGKAI